MLNLTPEERKAAIFLLSLGFCGLVLNHFSKVNSRVQKLVYAQVQPEKLDLNKADFAQLSAFQGISKELARNILEYRSRKDFDSLEELKQVKGIKNKRYEKLKELFFVD